MSRWWRAYDEAVDDHKLCSLTDKQHRAWFNLCCITSQNAGKLPAMAAVAFKLRIAVDKARAIVAELAALGLIDVDQTGSAAPHNWGARQFQSDTSTERVKRFRNGKRNVSETSDETPPETEQKQTQKEDDGGDAGARGSMISAEASSLAEEIAVKCGITDRLAWPPGWCGAAYLVQKWLSEGWKSEIILLAVAATLKKRKEREPPYSVKFFENEIARSHARLDAPLPVVTLTEPEQINAARHENSSAGSVVDAARKMRARLAHGSGGDALRRISEG